MRALDPTDARRLKSSLAMLASSHEGEKLAAIAAVQRILDKAGLGFTDLSAPVASPFSNTPPSEDRSPAWGPRPRPNEVRLRPAHQRRALLLLVSGFEWDRWERKFLNSMKEWSSPLSDKQASRLRELEMVAAAWRATREAEPCE